MYDTFDQGLNEFVEVFHFIPNFLIFEMCLRVTNKTSQKKN